MEQIYMQENTKIFTLLASGKQKLKLWWNTHVLEWLIFFRTNVNTSNATQGKLDASHTAGWNVKWYSQPIWKTFW